VCDREGIEVADELIKDEDLSVRTLLTPPGNFQIEPESGRSMKATDVFTPQRLPTVTLVKDHLGSLEEKYKDALDEGGKLVRVVGPSKSGKTVFIKNMAGADLVLVTGANIVNTEQLWLRVLDAVGCDVSKTTTASKGTTREQEVGGKIEGNVFIAKGAAQGNMKRGQSEDESVTTGQAVDIFQTVIKELAKTGVWIFVDDFHYIPKIVQSRLAGELKQAVESGVLIACAAVPFRSEDALRANDDLQGRIADLQFEYWEENELIEIARLGFSELKIEKNDNYFLSLAKEAAGSPQLMQSLCLDTCRELGIRETASSAVIIPDGREFLSRVCERVANSVDFTTTVDRMKAGPLTRGKQRIAYLLADDTTADVYPILIKAIAQDPPTLHFIYKDLQTRVARICANAAPHFSDPCYHIAKIANEGHQADKIDWDSENHVLSIRDPYLLFAIRWC